MSRALAIFRVRAGVSVRVRLLATRHEVEREYRGGRRRRDRLHIHAYFAPARCFLAPDVGTIVLPADGRLEELVPHEVTHAVMHWLGEVRCASDERLATAVGILTARILAKLRRLGYLEAAA